MRFDTDGGPIVFQVEDRGSGKSASETLHAAQRFWRHSDGPGQGQGSGLGLSIVEAIAKRFGGKLRLSPGPQGGLVAQLRLPAAA